MFNFEFHSPWFLALFLLSIPLIIKDLKKRKQKGILIPSTQNIQMGNGYFWVNKILTLSKYFILSALIIALASHAPTPLKTTMNRVLTLF